METFSFEFERYIKHSKIHYGFTGGGFSIIPRINQNGVTLKDISQSLLKPSNLNQTIDPNEISGRVYFDFTLGLMQYYSLIGEYDISCEILKDYIAFDNLENVKNNLNFHSSEVIFSCLKKTIIEGDRSFLTYLTDQQREQVQKDLLSQLIEGKKSLNYLINLSLFDDKEGLQALDEISETCLLLTDYEFQKEHISIFANCLHDLLIENIDFIKKHQFLRNLATEIVKSYYNHWLNTNKNHFGAALYYAQTVPTMYREFEQGEKSCESLWQTLAAPLGITFLKHNTNILLNYNSSVDNFLDNLLRISQFSNCNNITFFEFNFNKLVFNTNGRILVKNLANDILVDLINDVTVYKLLSDIENNLVNITSFSENYKAEEKLKQWFNLIKKDPINWLRQEYEYYTNKLKIPKSELSGIINLIYNENNFKLYENVTINDKVSNWLPLINQFPLTDNNGEIRTSLSQEISKLHLLEHYFIDSFSSQLFGMMPNFTDKEQKHFFQRVTQRIRNQRLDQMVLYENLTSVDATPAQRSATLQILEREYSDSVSNSILKHFEFYVNYKNGDFKKALLALDTLIELNELPYSDFYRFAKSVIQFLANTKICTGNPEGAKRILDKLLKNTSNDYWDNPSGTNHVSLRLQEYLRQFVINEGKNDPELVEVFKSCID